MDYQFHYTVFIEPLDSDDVIAKEVFDNYDKAHEFAETWAANGFGYCIVEG